MLFKLSNLNSNLALTLGYLNPALNNSAPIIWYGVYEKKQEDAWRRLQGMCWCKWELC